MVFFKKRNIPPPSDLIVQPPLYTIQFLLLCLSHLLFGASFTMIIPELPAYLTSSGRGRVQGVYHFAFHPHGRPFAPF
jgi:hypothetical protein